MSLFFLGLQTCTATVRSQTNELGSRFTDYRVFTQRVSTHSWLLVQLQTLEDGFNGFDKHRWVRVTSFRTAASTKPLLSFPYRWQRWNNLVLLLATLAKYKVSVVGLTSKKLCLWSLALGWSTWVGPKLDWLLLQQFIKQREIHKLNSLVKSSCFLVTDSFWTKSLSTLTNLEHIPSLGLSQPIRDSRGLWYSLPLESQGLFHGEFVLWFTLWLFLKVNKCFQMSNIALVLFSSVWFGLFLISSRRWVYIAWAVLVEVCWVALVAAYGYLALELSEPGFLFWGILWLFLSAVELCLCLFSFLLLSELQGSDRDY